MITFLSRRLLLLAALAIAATDAAAAPARVRLPAGTPAGRLAVVALPVAAGSGTAPAEPLTLVDRTGRPVPCVHMHPTSGELTRTRPLTGRDSRSVPGLRSVWILELEQPFTFDAIRCSMDEPSHQSALRLRLEAETAGGGWQVVANEIGYFPHDMDYSDVVDSLRLPRPVTGRRFRLMSDDRRTPAPQMRNFVAVATDRLSGLRWETRCRMARRPLPKPFLPVYDVASPLPPGTDRLRLGFRAPAFRQRVEVYGLVPYRDARAEAHRAGQLQTFQPEIYIGGKPQGDPESEALPLGSRHLFRVAASGSAAMAEKLEIPLAPPGDSRVFVTLDTNEPAPPADLAVYASGLSDGIYFLTGTDPIFLGAAAPGSPKISAELTNSIRDGPPPILAILDRSVRPR